MGRVEKRLLAISGCVALVGIALMILVDLTAPRARFGDFALGFVACESFILLLLVINALWSQRGSG